MIYVVVLCLYLGLLLVIGLLWHKRTKGDEDYYLGGRRIGVWVTALSYVAAYFSSVVIVGGAGYGYKYGMATIWIGAFNVLFGGTLCWILLGERIRELTHRYNSITLPDFLGKLYNSEMAKMFSAIVIVLFMIVYNVSILKGMGHSFEVLMDMPYWVGVILSGLIILIYVVLGGYFAVVWTGFVQAIIMMVALVMITGMALRYTGGVTIVHEKLRLINEGLVTTPGIWGAKGLFSFALVVSLGVWGMPQLIVRFYSIKRKELIRVGAILATLGCSMAVLPYFNGTIARILFPHLKSPDLAIPSLVKLVLNPFGEAIFLVGVIAAGMSTFSAILIILSSSIVKDLVRYKERGLLHGRLWSVMIGLISLGIALKPPALVLTLCAFAWAVVASITLFPLIFGIYMREPYRIRVIYSMLGGFVTSLVWLILRNPYGIHGFIPGVVVSLLVIMIQLTYRKCVA